MIHLLFALTTEAIIMVFPSSSKIDSSLFLKFYFYETSITWLLSVICFE